MQVAQAFHSLMARSLGFLFPRFTALQNNKLAKLQLFNRAMFATTLVGSTLAVSLFLASPWLLNVWLGAANPRGSADHAEFARYNQRLYGDNFSPRCTHVWRGSVPSRRNFRSA